MNQPVQPFFRVQSHRVMRSLGHISAKSLICGRSAKFFLSYMVKTYGSVGSVGSEVIFQSVSEPTDASLGRFSWFIYGPRTSIFAL